MSNITSQQVVYKMKVLAHFASCNISRLMVSAHFKLYQVYAKLFEICFKIYFETKCPTNQMRKTISTIIDRAFGTGFGFHVEWRNTGRV